MDDRRRRPSRPPRERIVRTKAAARQIEALCARRDTPLTPRSLTVDGSTLTANESTLPAVARRWNAQRRATHR